MSSYSNKNMEMDDIEIDGECISHRGIYKHESSMAMESKCDSGFSSIGSNRSGHSFDSVDGDFVKRGVVGSTPSTELSDRFKGLSVVHDAKKSLEPLSSDEGFCGSNEPSLQSSNEEHLYMQVTPEAMELFQQDTDGDSQLHMAIINLLNPIALYIISKAPHPDWLNLPNNLLQTPLHLAVMMRMSDVVRKLMVYGADIDPRDNKGDTPLTIACREGFDEIVQILMRPVQDLERQNKAIIPYQKVPQDLESRNYNGQTCLHVAAEGTHLPCIRLLFNHGANVNATDGKSGRTVLHYAAESGNRILLEFLLQNPKVNVHARTYAGLTSIMLALGRGFGDIVMRLRQSGAKIEYSLRDESDTDEEMS